MKRVYILGEINSEQILRDKIEDGTRITLLPLVADSVDKLFEYIDNEYDAIILDPIRTFNFNPVYFCVKDERVEILSYLSDAVYME